MAIEKRLQHLYEFGPFRLDASERLLWRQGEKVPLTPKAFETLLALVERPGRLVTKDELMKVVWPDTIVEEANLTNNVWALRKTLDEGQNGNSYIETVPKRGYRFTTDVKEVSDPGPDLVVERHTRTRIITEEEESADNENQPATAPALLTRRRRAENRGWPKWQVAGALALILLTASLIAILLAWRSPEAVHSEVAAINRPPKSIAVLPFKTIGAESDNEYLSLGMSEALITRLGKLRQLMVRPPSAVRRYTDVQQDAVAAGREQGVEAVLDGSIQRSGDRIRVTVQLMRVADRAVLWSGQFEERITDIFAVQDSISRQVAEGLMLKLSDEERRRLQRGHNENFEAYQAYRKGRLFWNKRTLEGYKKAVEYFNQSIEKDPAYAQAYAGLADALLFLGDAGALAHNESIARARAALKRATEMDGTLAEPHATLGLIAMNYDWDWAEAEREFKRAIELNPNYATAHHWYGEFLSYMGRFDEGLAEIRRAQELDPLSLIISTDMGKAYFLSRQYERAREQCIRTLEIDPDFSTAHVWLGFTYSAMGQHKMAIAEFNKIKELKEDPAWLSYLGYVYGAAGQREEARKILKQLLVLSKQTHVSPMSMVLVYMGLGEKGEVFKWYDRVFEEHTTGVADLKVNPGLDSLRNDPRYPELLRRANFAE